MSLSKSIRWVPRSAQITKYSAYTQSVLMANAHCSSMLLWIDDAHYIRYYLPFHALAIRADQMEMMFEMFAQINCLVSMYSTGTDWLLCGNVNDVPDARHHCIFDSLDLNTTFQLISASRNSSAHFTATQAYHFCLLFVDAQSQNRISLFCVHFIQLRLVKVELKL